MIEVTDYLRQTHPYMAQYIEMFGSENLPKVHSVGREYQYDIEKLYKKCVEENKPWTEFILQQEQIKGIIY
ncbi:MAG: hypothetical protein IJ291_01935 [Lachnospiraceae bacterium]|nr:hypothetical protein [Lachnospiraceae bacterium]